MRVFAKILAHPGDAFAFDDVIGVDHVLDARNAGHVSADNNHRVRRKQPRTAAHFLHLAKLGMIPEMPTMSY